MPAPRPPTGLGVAGRALWRAVIAAHDLDPAQRVMLEEACRAKDRLGKLDAVLGGDPATWAGLTAGLDGAAATPRTVHVDPVLAVALATARGMAQLLAALRLPDPRTGRRPPTPGRRGVYGAGRRR